MFIRSAPAMEVHTREEEVKEEEEEVFVAVSFGRDRERRASECSARGTESHRHERRNLRSHHPCMQMPRP